MNNLAQSEVFSLTLVIGTYLASLALYRKTRISLLHPLITSILVIIVVLKAMDIEYESFQKGSHLIHFLLGPSVVALGYVLYEQIQYLKGNVISILTSVFVGAIVGIVSVIAIGELMGADAALVATLEPKSVTTPIAMGIAEKSGGTVNVEVYLDAQLGTENETIDQVQAGTLRQLTRLVHAGKITSFFDVIRQIQDLVKQRHMVLAGGVAGDGIADILGHVVFGPRDGCRRLSVQHFRLAFFDGTGYYTVFPA